MKLSTASLTFEDIEKLRNKGYVVEVHADEEWADVFKPTQGEAKAA